MDGLSRIVEDLLGSRPVRSEKLPGGDLSDISRLTLDDGRVIVAKAGLHVAAEARMLAEISAARVPVPRVLGFDAHVLVLEHLPQAPASPEGWARLGEILSRLHRHVGEAYGWHEPYAFGAVEIDNKPADDWPSFWAARRLLHEPTTLPESIVSRLETLCHRLPDLLPKHPLPSLLHGDLWGGNLLFGPAGSVHLIDPASYHGDREVDLAMLHLFGTPGPEFAESYGPLAPGWQTRRAIYSLFPALVHYRLFGAGYRGLVERFLSAAGA